MNSKTIAVLLVLVAVAFLPSDAAPASEVVVVGRQPTYGAYPYGSTMSRGQSTVVVVPENRMNPYGGGVMMKK